MAIQPMALAVANPEINAVQAMSEGVNASQQAQSNQLTLAKQSLNNIGSMAFGVMGGKIDGQADPQMWEQSLDMLAGSGMNVDQFRGRPDLAPIVARASVDTLGQLNLAQNEAELEQRIKEFAFTVSEAAKGPAPTAAELQIARIMETGVPRNIAIGIADGVLKSDRHPVTGELQVVDMSTGKPVYGGPQQPAPQPAPEQSAMAPDVAQQFGQQFPASNQSFGVGGAAQGAINSAFDAIGVGAPYPDIQQTQADFGILRESLLNDIASAYGRQPPSWLLQEIRSLTPSAGNPMEGAGAAQSKLNALGRHLTNELAIANESLQRQLTPANRQELEAKVSGLEAGIARVTGAIGSFGGAPAADPNASAAPEGVEPDLWGAMTPEERALWK